MSDFSNRLKTLRTDRHLTQEEVAIELGVSRSTLGMYETGKREPDFETLETIADFFKVDMNYLIGYSDEPHDWEKVGNELGIYPPKDYVGSYEDFVKHKVNEKQPEDTDTLAAHFDGNEYSKEELEEIRQFAEFVKNRRK